MKARVAVVTGGASGNGKALAAALVGRGDVVTVADINAVGAMEVAEELTNRGPGQATGMDLDVRDASAVAKAIHSVTEEHGRLDLLFNNAGIVAAGTAEELTLEHWNRTIEVNLNGVVYGVHAAYPIMLEQGFGHIVNMASISGLFPATLTLPYTATKHAVVGLSLALRAEAMPHGVRVSVVCPGFVDTPMLDHPNPDLPQTAIGKRGRALASELAAKTQFRLYSADRLAADVLRGIDRNKALIIAPWMSRLAWRVSQLSPSLTVRVAARQTARIRKDIHR